MPSLPEILVWIYYTASSWYCCHKLTALHTDNDIEHNDNEDNDDDDADDSNIMTSVSVVLIIISQAKDWTGENRIIRKPPALNLLWSATDNCCFSVATRTAARADLLLRYSSMMLGLEAERKHQHCVGCTLWILGLITTTRRSKTTNSWDAQNATV